MPTKSTARAHCIPLTEFRARLSAVLKTEVAGMKRHIIIENSGVPLAVVMDVGAYEDYRDARDEEAEGRIAESTAEYLAGKSRPASEFLRELRAAKARAPRAGKRGRRRRPKA